MKNYNRKNGFTLVELAIVLTIIALIVGGIVGGEKLVDNYRVAGMVANFEKYKNAFDEFNKQYMAIPGDVNDAVNLFPAGNGYSSAANNGNGNNQIEWVSNSLEQFYAWQHLARAQFINGNYSGSGSNTDYKPGINVPAGSHESSMFRMFYTTLNSRNGHYLLYSRALPNCSSNCERAGIISAPDALAFDRKFDDGISNTGRITSDDSSASSDSGQACASGGSYQATNRGKVCISYMALDN